jgi:hypothetical protein
MDQLSTLSYAIINDMAAKTYNVGNIPPEVIWTVVRRDTASFRTYVTDDLKQPLNIPDWTIQADVRRNGELIFTLIPEATEFDGPGEFTVSLLSNQSELLQTGDIFDVQLSDATRVWTVAQGSFVIIEDVTI